MADKQLFHRESLRADCSSCAGLCCTALAFSASIDFAYDKAAGKPCKNLQRDFRCSIHGELLRSGFKGCVAFECYGAGQQVTQKTFGGKDWIGHPEIAQKMFSTLPVMIELHEMLWYLMEAREMPCPEPLGQELQRQFTEIKRLSGLAADDLIAVDAAALRNTVRPLLAQAGMHMQKASKKSKAAKDFRGKELMGAELKGGNLVNADFTGAYLIAANCRLANFSKANFLGADLRDADISGADLTDSLFLTQQQVNAAIGDSRTKLPEHINRPSHWAKGQRNF
ncbi:pentapeptide repeat-containing protein [Planococcus sp. APC 3906]|uniref:pentapeptide repeat-containing protein n=1 Tax=Planococcus sp. APC 3906 TaxID=3035194 RepID=UPI0025B5B0AA|nr:pentapeptide repeat-containing protein [Planococcus sp. APC 3906]MDN3450587.1 pentapeptide repeat-containing protein [Planococcus sp. APC 3906]